MITVLAARPTVLPREVNGHRHCLACRISKRPEVEIFMALDVFFRGCNGHDDLGGPFHGLFPHLGLLLHLHQEILQFIH